MFQTLSNILVQFSSNFLKILKFNMKLKSPHFVTKMNLDLTIAVLLLIFVFKQ